MDVYYSRRQIKTRRGRRDQSRTRDKRNVQLFVQLKRQKNYIDGNIRYLLWSTNVATALLCPSSLCVCSALVYPFAIIAVKSDGKRKEQEKRSIRFTSVRDEQYIASPWQRLSSQKIGETSFCCCATLCDEECKIFQKVIRNNELHSVCIHQRDARIPDFRRRAVSIDFECVCQQSAK